MTQTTHERRYDIDWLRNLAFLILIFYHIGMYYVQDWGWHIKSEHSVRWLQEVMIMSNTWRMSLLFFISAMALSLIEKRYSVVSLLKLRSTRLLVPLLFGMFVIVAPQVYVEALNQQLIEPGFINFWLEYINPNTELLKTHQSDIGLLTWNHLWFIPYLWVYSVLVLAIRPILANCISSPVFQRIPFSLALLTVLLLLLLAYLFLRLAFPTTHALTDDWYNHAKYFAIFVFGYLFAGQPQWWNSVITRRRLCLYVAIAGYLFIVADRNGAFSWLAEHYETSTLVKAFYGSVFIINLLAWLFCVVGYAGRYLRMNKPILTYANKAVLPWYMLHQSIIVVVAWYLKPASLDALSEFMLILLATTAGCFLGYELVKRFALTRFLFGIR